jgi:hypothetical protein
VFERGSVKPNNARYAHLWLETRVGESKKLVLARWPKNPYQHYRDGTSDDCYEWADNPGHVYKNLPSHLYNLCFHGGTLHSKTVF